MDIDQAIKLFDEVVRSKCDYTIEIINVNIFNDNKIYIFTRIFKQGFFVKNKQYIIDIKTDLKDPSFLGSNGCNTTNTNIELAGNQITATVQEVAKYIQNNNITFEKANVPADFSFTSNNSALVYNGRNMGISLRSYFRVPTSEFNTPGGFKYIDGNFNRKVYPLEYYESNGIPISITGYYIRICIWYSETGAKGKRGYLIGFIPKSNNPDDITAVYGVQIECIIPYPN